MHNEIFYIHTVLHIFHRMFCKKELPWKMNKKTIQFLVLVWVRKSIVDIFFLSKLTSNDWECEYEQKQRQQWNKKRNDLFVIFAFLWFAVHVLCTFWWNGWQNKEYKRKRKKIHRKMANKMKIIMFWIYTNTCTVHSFAFYLVFYSMVWFDNTFDND